VGTLLAQIDLPSLSSKGPDQLRWLLTTSFILLPGGMVIGIIGRIVESRAVVAVGTVLILAGGAAFLVAAAQYG
jgi:hypothetical protein